MTDQLDEKQKGVPRRAAWPGYVAAALALGVCLLPYFFITATSQFLMDHNTRFYPLVLVTHSPTLSIVMWVSTIVVFFGLLIFAMRRRAIIVGALVLLAGLMVLLMTAFMSMVATRHITPKQTISHNDQVYQLVSMYEMTVFDSPTKSYGIVLCDGTGLMCRYSTSPYSREYMSREDRQDYNNFEQTPAVLFIDPTDQLLKLRVGDEVYSINSNQRSVWQPGMKPFD